MNLFQLLSKDERVIVMSSEEDGYIYTWNQDKVLECWKDYGSCKDCGPEANWQKVNILTLDKVPRTFAEARQLAIDWYNQLIKADW